MSVFKDSKLAHFTGVDISHLTLEVLKTNIQEKAQEEKSEENNFMGRGIAYLQIQHAINLQDSFRVIKETLNAQSNNLESQKWHKLELYAKELELGYRGEIKNLEKDTKTFEDTAKQDVINNKKSKGLYIPHIKQNDSAQILEINKRERLRNTIDRIQLWFYRHTSDHHTDLLKIASWVLVAIGCFGVLYLGTRVLQDASIITKLNPYGLALSFTGAILALPFCTTAQKPFFEFRRYLTILSSITTLWIACYKPILIFGAINLIDRSPRLGLENLLLVLYTLAMILLLFSLQKTARKNSIIPS
ncbi:hypothetical protein [Helicobacter pametensis]|uniref:hypothetical protein n=1 Tax=Helicobacter pametensis TaxID=95149 RepID=UPI0012EC49D4|nr:hypothetical protein [Helicobacter pametensis]